MFYMNKDINQNAPMITAATVTPGSAFPCPLVTDGTVRPTNALFVGGAGTIVARMADNVTIVTLTVPAGAWLPLAVLAISNASTATGIIAFW